MKTIFGICLPGLSLLLASCGGQVETDQPEAGLVETVVVTRDLQIEVLPMAQVGGEATRSAVDDEDKEKEAVHMTYNGTPSTRGDKGQADMTADEMKITTACILQFDGTSPKSVLRSKTTITAAQIKAGTPVTCTFNMAPGRKNRVYVVANADPMSLWSEGSTTLEAIDSQSEHVNVKDVVPEAGFVMSTYQDVGVGDEFGMFRLKSRMARLTVIGPGTLTLKRVPTAVSYKPSVAGDKPVRGIIDTDYTNEAQLTSGKTYYIPENLSGRNELVHKPYLRALGLAPDPYAMYVEVLTERGQYQLLLGDGSVSDFNVAGNCAYDITITIYPHDINSYDLRLNNPMPTPPVDLNKTLGGTANCYVASAANSWYFFDATVMGNGATTPAHTKGSEADDANFPAIIPSKLDPNSAVVLWETSNTDVAPAKGSIVSENLYFLKGRKLLFKTGAKEGNALIAAKGAYNHYIIWSWHIWRLDEKMLSIPLSSISSYATQGELVMMDRNLGALSDNLDRSTGLLYQWGRKDPFVGAAELRRPGPMAVTGTSTSVVGSGSPDHAVANPTVYYNSADNWTVRNDNLWGTPLTTLLTGINKNKGSKSIYDPCPVGWRVPPGYTFANANRNSGFYRGYNFSIGIENRDFWFPASGIRNNKIEGLLGSVGVAGCYWTSSGRGAGGDCLEFTDSSLDFKSVANHAKGGAVRCVKE